MAKVKNKNANRRALQRSDGVHSSGEQLYGFSHPSVERRKAGKQDASPVEDEYDAETVVAPVATSSNPFGDTTSSEAKIETASPLSARSSLAPTPTPSAYQPAIGTTVAVDSDTSNNAVSSQTGNNSLLELAAAPPHQASPFPGDAAPPALDTASASPQGRRSKLVPTSTFPHNSRSPTPGEPVCESEVARGIFPHADDDGWNATAAQLMVQSTEKPEQPANTSTGVLLPSNSISVGRSRTSGSRSHGLASQLAVSATHDLRFTAMQQRRMAERSEKWRASDARPKPGGRKLPAYKGKSSVLKRAFDSPREEICARLPEVEVVFLLLRACWMV